jgi:hypothetical protein
MLWPLNSALTQVAVNGLAEAADRAEYCQAAGLTDKAFNLRGKALNEKSG